MDILLNKDGKINLTDLKLSITGDLADKVSQRLFIRLRSNKGYWFMDKTFGVDWINTVTGKRKTKDSIDAILQGVIYKDKYVTEIIKWKSEVSGRAYSCEFTVKISSLQDSLLTVRLLTNESGLVIEDSEGNFYQVT